MVLAATWFELAPLLVDLVGDNPSPQRPPGWPELRTGSLAGVPVVITAGGIGKANTAAAIAAVHATAKVSAVLQLGIGGAYPAARGGTFVPLGTVAVAASEYDLDLGVGAGPDWTGLESLGFAAVATDPPTFNLIPCHAQLSARAARTISSPLLPFATSDSVTADMATAVRIAEGVGAAVESMEGAAAAQVCLALGLPFVELRAISNQVGVRDKDQWRIREAIAVAAGAALEALPTLRTV